MDRPKGKNRKPKGRERRPPPRRMPPPPTTGREAAFYASVSRSGAEVVLTLADGRKITGTVRDFDRDLITIEDSSGPMVIRKSDIRYVHEDD